VIHSPVAYPLFLCLLLLLVAVFELRILTYGYVFAVRLLSLLGSQVNIPIYRGPVTRGRPPTVISMSGWRPTGRLAGSSEGSPWWP
jgi:hypothetical protein